MGDRDDEIRELTGKVQRTGRQFLRVELQTCFTALEMAEFELSIGNIAMAEREVAAVEKGVSVIQRFLSPLPEDQKRELAANLAELTARLESIKAGLDLRRR